MRPICPLVVGVISSTRKLDARSSFPFSHPTLRAHTPRSANEGYEPHASLAFAEPFRTCAPRALRAASPPCVHISTHPNTGLANNFLLKKVSWCCRAGCFLRSLFLPSFLARAHPWRKHAHPPPRTSPRWRWRARSRLRLQSLRLICVRGEVGGMQCIRDVGGGGRHATWCFLSDPFFFVWREGQASFLAYV